MGSGKFIKNGMISVESGRFGNRRSKFEAVLEYITCLLKVVGSLGADFLLTKAKLCAGRRYCSLRDSVIGEGIYFRQVPCDADTPR